MAKLINYDSESVFLGGDVDIICSGDWHVGSDGFRDDVAKAIIDRLKREEGTYIILNGDLIEGKPTSSKHYRPATLRKHLLSIQKQMDHVADLLDPVSHKILSLGYGNHDMYIMNDYDPVQALCTMLGNNYIRGGYQTWVQVAGVRVFHYHGIHSLPRGAKDPIQRDANRRAWLKREMESLAGDCHVMLMGHVHTMLTQPPLLQRMYMNRSGVPRTREFVEPVNVLSSGETYVPKESRWYGITGTLRESLMSEIDYGEIAGFSPPAIGHLELRVRSGVTESLFPVPF